MDAIRDMMGWKGIDAVSILLVDENPIFLRVTSRILREYYRDELMLLGMSPGNHDALDQSQRLKPRVILIGMGQNGDTSLWLIPLLRVLLPDVKIVVLGQLDMPAYRQAAMDAGADAFVAKVALSHELLPTIRRVTDTRPALAPIPGNLPGYWSSTLAMELTPIV